MPSGENTIPAVFSLSPRKFRLEKVIFELKPPLGSVPLRLDKVGHGAGVEVADRLDLLPMHCRLTLAVGGYAEVNARGELAAPFQAELQPTAEGI